MTHTTTLTTVVIRRKIMVTINKVKEIVTGAAIAVPVFWIGGKILRTIKDEFWPSDDDEDIVFDDDD